MLARAEAHAGAQEFLRIDSFAVKPGTVRADPNRNMLIIQGSGADRRAARVSAISKVASGTK